MRVLFGPDEDCLHIDPLKPGGYEWWYFDALSDDSRHALVVIFFLGTPMSPYYPAVIAGRHPVPMDWCGVFFTLHERRESSVWQEVAYAYNVYTTGEFSTSQSMASMGQSAFTRDDEGNWQIVIREGCLWAGSVEANLSFAPVGNAPAHEAIGSDDGHTWICVAPFCGVSGTFTLANGQQVAFSGHGYHDHNFGQLPWTDNESWFWGRGRALHPDTETPLTFITYMHRGGREPLLLVLEETTGTARVTTPQRVESFVRETRNGYGLPYRSSMEIEEPDTGLVVTANLGQDRVLLEGPFYGRWVSQYHLEGNTGKRTSGNGICEVFEPNRLCHWFFRHAMWSRIRRPTRRGT